MPRESLDAPTIFPTAKGVKRSLLPTSHAKDSPEDQGHDPVVDPRLRARYISTHS